MNPWTTWNPCTRFCFVEMFVGVGASRVRDLFEQAKAASPAREGILRIHTRHLPLAPDVSLDALAAATAGFSGADLANLANEAALVAARLNHPQVTRADFTEAQDKALLGGVRRLLLSEEDRRVIAYHEGGHAVVAWLTPGADPVLEVTIIPRGKALGVTEQVPETERYNASRDYLLGRLAVMLGGRTAEELVIGDITTGAENDLIEATRLARRMVARWGMGSLGEVAFPADEQQPFLGYEIAQGRDYSEQTAARIDKDVEQLLAERHEAVRHLSSGVRESLDRLVAALLEHETVGPEELDRILGPLPKRAPMPPPLQPTTSAPTAPPRPDAMPAPAGD